MCEIDLYHQGAPSFMSKLTYFDAAFVAWKHFYIEPKLDTFLDSLISPFGKSKFNFYITALDVFEGNCWGSPLYSHHNDNL